MLSQLFGWSAPGRSEKVRPTTRRLGVETLDDRRMCAVGVTNGVLTITGTGGADTVRVAQTPTQFQVTVNGHQTNVARGGVTRIDAYLGNGNDVYVGAGIAVPQRLYGQAGNDRLTGGAAADRIFGGIGNDVLVGNNGNDYLDGGAGIDWMYGNAGANTYVANDGGTADRLVGVTSRDTVRGDAIGTVRPMEQLNDHTNAIAFYGNRIELIAAQDPPGTSGIFYRVRINGQPWRDLYRAANIITLFTPTGGNNGVTIDPTLRAELEANGWLRLGILA